MNQVGVYYGFLANSDQVDWHDCLQRAAKAGAEVLEVSAPKLRDVPQGERAAIARLARDLGLVLTMATSLPMDADVSSPEKRIWQAGVDLLLGDVELAGEMGAQAIGGVVTGPSKHFPEGIEHTRRKALENSIRALRIVGKRAAEAKVIVAAEVVNRFESPLMNTSEEALRVMEEIDIPAVGIHLDTFHMNIEEAQPGDAIRRAGERLVHFHVCENNRALPGKGHIAWQVIFSALGDIGYQGKIVIESLPGPYGSIASRMNIWRRLAEDVDGELAEAIAFVKRQMGR